MTKFDQEDFLDLLIDGMRVKPTKKGTVISTNPAQWNKHPQDVCINIGYAWSVAQHILHYLQDHNIKPRSVIAELGPDQMLADEALRAFWSQGSVESAHRFSSFAPYSNGQPREFSTHPAGDTLYLAVNPTIFPRVVPALRAIDSDSNAHLLGMLAIVEPQGGIDPGIAQVVQSLDIWSGSMISMDQIIAHTRIRIFEGRHPRYKLQDYDEQAIERLGVAGMRELIAHDYALLHKNPDSLNTKTVFTTQ